MQLKNIFVLFFILVAFSKCHIDAKQNYQVEFWQSVFDYLTAKHFSNSVTQKIICTEAIIHLNHDNMGDYIYQYPEKVKSFFGVSMKDKIQNRKISEIEFQKVNFPISFQDFNKISKEERFFTKKLFKNKWANYLCLYYIDFKYISEVAYNRKMEVETSPSIYF